MSPSKKAATGKSSRKIDRLVSSENRKLKSKFVLIPSMQIKTWKVLVIIMFAGGFFAALVWGAYNDWFSESLAGLKQAAKKRAPVITAGTPNGELGSGTKTTAISVKTQYKATCWYRHQIENKSTKYRKFSQTRGLDHVSLLSDLEDGKSYAYYVRCKDLKTRKDSKPYKISFSVKKPGSSSGSPSGPAVKACITAGNISQSPSLGPNGNFGECCSGLKTINNGLRYDPTSKYANAQGCVSFEGAGLICSNCGNGNCEAWENLCNCSSDCNQQCVDNNADGICDSQQSQGGCLDVNRNGVCDCEDCYDYNGDGVCDAGLNCISCEDNNGDGVCD